MKVFVCMPELRLKKARLDREIYVVAFGSDLRGESNHRPPATGANNLTLGGFAPEVAAAMKFFVISASNIFHHIDKDQPLQLGGDGIILYPPADPRGMLALHVSVVESDAGARNQGKLLEQLFKDKGVASAMRAIADVTGAAGPIPTEVLAGAMQVITDVLPKILQANQDDNLFDFDFSGVAMSRYRGTAEGTRYTFENKKVAAAIQVFVGK
jgi:hypothetical protein